MHETDAIERPLTKESGTENQQSAVNEQAMDLLKNEPQKEKGDKEFYRALDKCMNDMNGAVHWGGKGAATFAIGPCNDVANGTLNREERGDFVRSMNNWTERKNYPVVFGLDRQGYVYGAKRQ